jgi:hypothetical protein
MEQYNAWNRLRNQIRDSCKEFDSFWIKRRRQFDTFSMVSSLMELISGADKSYQQILSGENIPFKSSPAASSFCVARSKLPACIIDEIRRGNLNAWNKENVSDQRWHGFRTFAVDGSKITLPRALLKQDFKTPHCGYCPEALLSVLFRLSDKMVYDLRLSKQKDERAEAFFHLNTVGKGDLIIYDRGYISYNLILEHLEKNVTAVFRVPYNTSFKECSKFWQSKETDTIVELHPSYPTKRKAKLAYPQRFREQVRLRLIKYVIGEKTYVLATTHLDMKIPARDYRDLYSTRWGAEEIYKIFKKTFSLEDFHSQNENGIKQELYAVSLLWNLSQQVNQIAQNLLKKAFHVFNFNALSNQLQAISFCDY